jgi:hypothetical protein
MGDTINEFVIGIVTIYCAYWVASAVRSDYFRGSRRFGHHKIYRERQSRLYWFNVVMTIFVVLGLLFLTWELLLRKSFR